LLFKTELNTDLTYLSLLVEKNFSLVLLNIY